MNGLTLLLIVILAMVVAYLVCDEPVITCGLDLENLKRFDEEDEIDYQAIAERDLTRYGLNFHSPADKPIGAKVKYTYNFYDENDVLQDSYIIEFLGMNREVLSEFAERYVVDNFKGFKVDRAILNVNSSEINVHLKKEEEKEIMARSIKIGFFDFTGDLIDDYQAFEGITRLGQLSGELVEAQNWFRNKYVEPDELALFTPYNSENYDYAYIVTSQSELTKDITEEFKELVNDSVEHPSHYTQGGIECIDSIKGSQTKEMHVGYLDGNIKKYVWRWKHKNGVEDLKKARKHLDWLIDLVQED